MKDQFVTYEIAKKLKELGFNEECLAAYMKSPKHLIKEQGDFGLRTHGNPFGFDIGSVFNDKLKDQNAATPLWQQAIDWLREKHKIEIAQNPSIRLQKGWFQFDVTQSKPHLEDFTSAKTYNEARETAILKALELITK